jgi:hypothetical protein
MRSNQPRKLTLASGAHSLSASRLCGHGTRTDRGRGRNRPDAGGIRATGRSGHWRIAVGR